MRKIKQIFAGILTVLIVFSTLGESLQLHASELASQAESVSGGKDGTEIWEPGQEESEFDEVEASEEESVADGTEAIEEESVADGTEAIEEESVADGAVSVEEESVANGAEPGQEESGVGEPEAVEKDGGTDGTESGQEESGTDKAEIAQEESVINDESTESGQHSVFVEQDSESIGMYAVPKAAGDLPENWVTVENPPVTQFVSDNKGGYCYKISYESTSGNSYIGKIFDAQGDLKEEQIKFSFDFMYESIGDGAKTQFFMDGSNIKPGTWATRVEIDAKGYLYVNGVNKPVEANGSRVTINKSTWYTLGYDIDNQRKTYTVQLMDSEKNVVYTSGELGFNNKAASEVPIVRVGSFSVSPSKSKADTNTRTDLYIDNICLMSGDDENILWGENFGESEITGEEPATPNAADWDYMQLFTFPDNADAQFMPDGWEAINQDSLSAVIEKGTENYFYKIAQNGDKSAYIGKKFNVTDQYTLSFDMNEF